MRTKLVHLAVFAAVVAAPATMSATEAAVNAERRRLSRQAVQLIQQDRIEPGCATFERANAYGFRPNAVWNVATCHSIAGRGELALAFIEKYIELVPAAGSSQEVQEILDRYRRATDATITRSLEDQLSSAVEAAEAGGGTTIPAAQRTYGGSTDSPGESQRRAAVSRFGTSLFQRGLQNVTAGDWDSALGFFERSLTYRSLRNAAYNIAEIHLHDGHRDLALHFFRLYGASLPAVQSDQGFRTTLQELADSPPQVGGDQRRTELSARISTDVNRALGQGGGSSVAVSPAPSGNPCERRENWIQCALRDSTVTSFRIRHILSTYPNLDAEFITYPNVCTIVQNSGWTLEDIEAIGRGSDPNQLIRRAVANLRDYQSFVAGLRDLERRVNASAEFMNECEIDRQGCPGTLWNSCLLLREQWYWPRQRNARSVFYIRP